MRLAPPPNHLPDTPPRSNPGQENGEDPTLRGRIDLRVNTLKPFLEPLNTLLEMDEINDARVQFEETVNNVTAAVQDYFHLQPTRPETSRPNNGGCKYSGVDEEVTWMMKLPIGWCNIKSSVQVAEFSI
ncbi:hypothetical protein TNIN_25321 [Trichonephila inaurata madagascariensis]|uniref:Uncharacterized protein n=1 Tax=Trichonephila inaurata madagascariensis TaxID=2747483 RepID=A0A8X6MLS5_9ARAC|nr:hypothetical protein TNIN_25321 [Trichonephila inaurata madagascariensis]